MCRHVHTFSCGNKSIHFLSIQLASNVQTAMGHPYCQLADDGTVM
jgi:hypothetical protein